MSVMDLRSKITAVNLVTRVRRLRRMWPPGISFDFEQTKEKLQESLKTRLESIREGVEKTIFQNFNLVETSEEGASRKLTVMSKF